MKRLLVYYYISSLSIRKKPKNNIRRKAKKAAKNTITPSVGRNEISYRRFKNVIKNEFEKAKINFNNTRYKFSLIPPKLKTNRLQNWLVNREIKP